MIAKKDAKYFIEKCNNNTGFDYPFFIAKLKSVQKLSKKINKSNKHYYKLSHIIWKNNMEKIINEDNKFPSEYFSKTILNTTIIKNKIINMPIVISPGQNINYVQLHHNKLLILDALFKQGSEPRYISDNSYLYSEHTGALNIANNSVEGIIIHTNTDRVDPNDKTIFLPNNSDDLLNYEFLFHTHPNTTVYAGRIHEGILYEFPSANDIMNFAKYHREGKAQGSLIITPEGMYVIRLINSAMEIKSDRALFNGLRDLILELEYKAINKFEKLDLADSDVFHSNVSEDFSYINEYNDFIKKYNLYIEYYPREKKNNEWCLRPINLAYV